MSGSYFIGIDGFSGSAKDSNGAGLADILIVKPEYEANQNSQIIIPSSEFEHADVGRVCRGSSLFLDSQNIKPENLADNLNIIKSMLYNKGNPMINGEEFLLEVLGKADSIVAAYMNQGEASLKLKKNWIWPAVADILNTKNLISTGRENFRTGAIYDLAKKISQNVQTYKIFLKGNLETLGQWRAAQRGITSKKGIKACVENLEQRLIKDVKGGQHLDPNSREFNQAYNLVFDVTQGYDKIENLGAIAHYIIEVLPHLTIRNDGLDKVTQANSSKKEKLQSIIQYGMAS